MVNRKYLYGGVEAGAYPEFMISGIGMEKRVGDRSDGTHLSAVKLVCGVGCRSRWSTILYDALSYPTN